MSSDITSEDRIRQHAYRLWEEAGRPHGRDVEFWNQAAALAAREASVPVKATAPAKATKAAAPAPKPRKKAAEPGVAAAAARPRARKPATHSTNSSG